MPQILGKNQISRPLTWLLSSKFTANFRPGLRESSQNIASVHVGHKLIIAFRDPVSVCSASLKGSHMAAKAKAPKSISKSEVLNKLAEDTGLARKQVAGVVDALSKLIASQVGKKGPGIISVAGLIKIQRIHKPAQPAKKGVPNPFKPGETMDVPAKPAKSVIKVRPLKSLKDMA